MGSISNRTVAFVATSSAASQELRRAAGVVAERIGYTFEALTRPPQSAAIRLMANADVTILDATIEPGGGSAYRSFSAQPMAMDHVLVVSRTPLPLNFHGRRGGGAPNRLETFDNSTLLDWLDRQLTALAARPRRNMFQGTLIGSALSLFVSPDADPHPSEPRAFVSYRREALHHARELAIRLGAGDLPHLDGPADVTFLEPGVIAFDDEILTGQLRWHLASLLSDRIAACSSLWICDSPNYLGSWWTRIELVLYRYFTYGTSRNRLALYRYHPDDGHVERADDIVPDLTYEQKRHIDRIISNTGSTMPADTVAHSRRMAELPALRDSPFWNDAVFSEDFALTPLLDLGHPRPHGTELTPRDLASTIDLADDELLRVPPDILATADSEGSAPFNGYTLRRDREQGERYVWYPIRMGRTTAPPGSLDDTLAALPIFRARKQ